MDRSCLWVDIQEVNYKKTSARIKTQLQNNGKDRQKDRIRLQQYL